MSLSVDNLYSALGSSSLGADTISATASADSLTSQISSAETDDEMMSACEEFETYLLQKMFQSMEETAKVFSDDEDEEGSEYLDMFSDTMYQSMAETMMASGNGLGIAQMLYDSMASNTSSDTTTDSAATATATAVASEDQ